MRREGDVRITGSLRRLQTDFIDLYQAHWYDESTPIEETLGAFTDLIQQGKVRFIGCSNYPAWRLMQALWASDSHHLARYDSLQPHYNLTHRDEYERELAEVCRTYGLAVLPYSPLAGGFLSGKYRRGESSPADTTDRSRGVERHLTDKNWALLDGVVATGRDHGRSPSAVALAWLLADPAITSPIIGPRNLEQLAENLQASGLHLSPEERARLDGLSH